MATIIITAIMPMMMAYPCHAFGSSPYPTILGPNQERQSANARPIRSIKRFMTLPRSDNKLC